MLFALAALLFTAPLLVVIIVAIWIESGGPILFAQPRTGLGGRVFTILKFRSMSQAASSEPLRQAVRGDARITRVGAFLRRTNLDELPQLMNVLRGEMSLVGPRPHAVAHDAYYAAEIPEYRERFQVRPGMTGLAQVNGCRGETPTVTHMTWRVAFDLEYIASASLALDVKILAQTLLQSGRDPAAY